MVSSGAGSGVSVRVTKRGRQGFASGTDTSAEGLRFLLDHACESALATFPDKARRLVKGDGNSHGIIRSVDWDRERDFPLQEKVLLKKLKVLEQQALRGDSRLKKALSLTFHEASGAHAIVNSQGLAVAEPWSAVSFSAEILGASGKETETAWGSTEKRLWADLDPRAVVEDVRGRLLTSFGARTIRSGSWPVIFSPRVGVDVVELLSQAVVADAAQKGRSFLSNRLGQTVGSREVSILDDGLFPGGWPRGGGTMRGFQNSER